MPCLQRLHHQKVQPIQFRSKCRLRQATDSPPLSEPTSRSGGRGRLEITSDLLTGSKKRGNTTWRGRRGN